MRISGFSGVEFGALRKAGGTLASRLSVIWGENESGKTTLARFFRQMLSSGPDWGELTPPGAGTLLVGMSDGRELKIEIDGRGKPAGLDEGFARVFCGDSGMDVKSALSSLKAALAIGQFTNFIPLTKKLDELERGLYAPGDPESSVNILLAEIESNGLQIENLQNQYPVYWELHEALKEKRGAMKNARLELEKNRQALARAELIAKARPVWFQARSLEEELASSDPVRDVPKGGLERLDELRERIAGLRTRLNERRRKNVRESSLRRQMENNPIMTILEYAEPLEALERELGRGGLPNAPEADGLAAEAERAWELFKRELADITPYWSEEDLAAADLSLAAERHGKNLCGAVRDLNGQMRKLLAEKAEEESAVSALKAEITARPGEDKPAKLDDYHTWCGVMQELRRDMLRNDALRWEIRAEKACAEVIENEMRSEGPSPQRPGKYGAKLFFAFFLSLSGVSAAVGAMAPSTGPYDVYAAFLCALAALGPFFSILTSKKEYMARLEQWRSRYARRNGELDEIDEKILEQRQEMQYIEASMEEKARLLGLKIPFMLSNLDEAANFMENERRDAEGLELKKIARKQLGDDLERHAARLNGLKYEITALTHELDAVLESWKNWLSQNSLPPELSPDIFDSFLAGARTARADLEALNGMRRKLASRREYEASINALIGELNAKTGLNLDKDGLTAVFNSLREARALRSRIEASLEERRTADLECSELEKELAAAVGGVRALCEEAGAGGEEELRAIYEKNSLRSAREIRLEEAKCTLAGILGEDASGGHGIGEPDFLADGLALAEKAEALRLAADDWGRSLDTLCGEVSALEGRLESMAPDGPIFALRQRNETLKILAKKEFLRWLAAVLLKRFMGKAAERGAKSLESDTFGQTEQFLSLMAGADWKIIPDEASGGADGIALERKADGFRLDGTRWSSGLSEQIALSMRLAAAWYTAERSEPVPILLDDVLARFDEARQKSAIEALWRASEKLQVIFFTCHRSTADMFASRLGGEKEFSLVEMSGGAFGTGSKKRAKRGKKL